MLKFTYRHYPSFTKRYVRFNRKQHGLPKSPAIEREIFRHILNDRDIMGTINGEMLMLEWNHTRSGKTLVPEPLTSERFKSADVSRVQGDAWSWPLAFSTVSLPAHQRFCGHKVEGIFVAWFDTSRLDSLNDKFLRFHHSEEWFEKTNGREHRLVVAIPNPLETQPSRNPTFLRSAFTPAEITEFVNSNILVPMDSQAAPLEKEEARVLRSVVRYVIAMGVYLSAYPETLTPGVPRWLKNKPPSAEPRAPMIHVR